MPQLAVIGHDERRMKLLSHVGLNVVPYASEHPAELVTSLDSSWMGAVFPTTADPALRDTCDMVDGLAKAVGALDTIVFQPTGNTRMTIGFTTVVGGMARAISEVSPNARFERTVIVGAHERAAAAIAVMVQLGAKHIVLAADSIAGPGSAVAAAHRMGVDVATVRLTDAPVASADIVVNTHALNDGFESLREAASLRENAIFVEFDGKCGFDVAMRERCVTVPAQLQELHQSVDQIRLFTGVNPDLDELRALID